MASNAKQVMKRMPILRRKEYVVHVPLGKDRYGMPIERAEVRTRLVPAYEFGIFTATGYGGRQLTAVVEADRFADAVGILSAPRTESGHSFKGFKKLKQS